MKMSSKRRDKVYKAIHEAVTDIRIELKLPANDDHKLAQVEHKIWRKQKVALGIE